MEWDRSGDAGVVNPDTPDGDRIIDLLIRLSRRVDFEPGAEWPAHLVADTVLDWLKRIGVDIDEPWQQNEERLRAAHAASWPHSTRVHEVVMDAQGIIDDHGRLRHSHLVAMLRESCERHDVDVNVALHQLALTSRLGSKPAGEEETSYYGLIRGEWRYVSPSTVDDDAGRELLDHRASPDGATPDEAMLLVSTSSDPEGQHG